VIMATFKSGVRTPIVFACVITLLTARASFAQVAVSDKVVNADRYPEAKVSFPGGVTGIPKITYYKPSSRPVLLDLYLPPGGTNTSHPFIVYMHGGGWSGGTPRTTGAYEDWPGVLASISAKGYIVASVDYRLSGEAPFPAAVQDIKAAIRWLRMNASTYGVDKTRGLVWGPSAGGHLAGLVGMSCGAKDLEPIPMGSAGGRAGRGAAAAAAPAAEESDCIQAVVGWYGVYDLSVEKTKAAARAEQGESGLERFLGCNVAACPESKIRAANPIDYVDPTDPPMLLVHGDSDTTAPTVHSKKMYEALKAKGVKTELILLPGINHSWIGKTHEDTIAASRTALEKTIAFIDATIGPKATVKTADSK
jgi:acetyl esterase/lipase